MKKFGILVLAAVLVFAAGSVAITSTGKAEAACPPNDSGCNQANSIAADITNSVNANTIYFYGSVYGPTTVITPQPAPIVYAAPVPYVQTFVVNTCGGWGWGCGGFCGWFACAYANQAMLSATLLGAGYNPAAQIPNGPLVPLWLILGQTH